MVGSIWDIPVKITITGDGLPDGVPDGKHLLFVRVVATGDPPLPGEAESVIFEVDATPPPAPLLITPASADVTPDITPEFVWTQVLDPSGVTYTLEVALGDQPLTGDFANPVFRVEGLTGDAVSLVFTGGLQVVIFTLPADKALTLGEYKWHVQAVDGSLNTGDFSPFNVFNVIPAIARPVLVFPGPGDFINDPTPLFDWRKPATGGPVSYQLQVTSVDIISGPFDINVIITGDPPEPPPDEFQVKTADALADGTYTWHVIARDAAGSPATSDARSFTLDTQPPPAVLLITPASGDVISDTTPDFVWIGALDPSGVTYILEIASGNQPPTGDFINPVFRKEGLTSDDVTIVFSGDDLVIQFTLPDANALALGEYKWHVQAVDRALNTGDFSVFNKFNVVSAIVGPKLVFPRSGDVINDPTPLFDWERPSTGDPAFYRLQVTSGDLNVGPFNINEEIRGTGDPPGPPPTQFVRTADALADDTYIWHVVAGDALGAVATSDARSFTVDATPPPSPEPISPPPPDEVFDSTPIFVWTQVFDPPSSGDVTYTLEIASGDQPQTGDLGEFVTTVFPINRITDIKITDLNVEVVTSGDQTLIEFTLPELKKLDPGVYSWHVQAVDTVRIPTGSGNPSGFKPFKTFTVVAAIDLKLVAEPRRVGSGDSFTVTINVETNRQAISTADVFVNFTTGDVEVLGIEAGDGALGFVLVPTFDNLTGSVDVRAATTGDPVTGDFILAVITFRAKPLKIPRVVTQIAFNCFDPDGSPAECRDPSGRQTDAAFNGRSVLGNAFATEAEVTVLGPTVDIKLIAQVADFDRAFPIPVTIRVETNGQKVDTALASLDFDAKTLEVVSIKPGGGQLGQVLLSSFDNATGRIDYSAITTGDPASGDFVLAVVNFRALTTADPTEIFFHQIFPRKTEASFKGITVLRKLVSVEFGVFQRTVDILLTTEGGARDFVLGREIPVTIRVENNDQVVSTVSAFLDFNPQVFEVKSIEAGTRLESVLSSRFDNVNGKVDFSATTFGTPATGDFKLVVVTFRAIGTSDGSDIKFHGDEGFPRETDATFRGNSVLRTADAARFLIFEAVVDILLTTPVTDFLLDRLVPVTILVKPNSQKVATVRTFLKFDPQILQVESITVGDGSLETVLINLVDNVGGTVHFSATTLEFPPPAKDFVLAVVTFKARATANLTRIDFIEAEATFKGNSVLRNRVPAVFNVFDVLISLEPAIRLAVQNEPVELTIRIEPVGGRSIDGAKIAIDFGAPVEFVSRRLDEGVEFARPSGEAGVATALDFEVKFTAVTSPRNLATITVRSPTPVSPTDPNVVLVNTQARKTVGRTGDQDVSAVVQSATVTVKPPFLGTPDLVSVAGKTGDEVFTNDNTPLFVWSAATGDVDTYLLQVVKSGDDIKTGPYVINTVKLHPTTVFQTAVPLADDTYTWRVIARDEFLNARPSATRILTVDTVIPAPPAALIRP